MAATPGAGRAASLRATTLRRVTPPSPATGREAGPPAMSLKEILQLVGGDLARVEREFGRHLGSDVDIVDTVGRYISEGGGKRIRPTLFLLCTKLCGYQGDRHILFASVFELIHTATLVHDDIIDGAELRRGRSSVNTRWGNHLTVLLGDYLYLKSMTLALTADDLRIIKILCDITLTMIEGELIQADRSGSLDISEREHLEIIRRKTAMLFSGCGRVAGVLAGASKQRTAALETYARHLGMAYQLTDDLLDFTATQSVLGKPVGSDLKEGRLTLPLIYLLELGVKEHRRKLEMVLQDGGFKRVDICEILGLVRRHRTLDRARRLAQAYSRKAVACLDVFEDGPAKRALANVATFITSRDH